MPSRSGPEAASGFSGVRRDCACTEMALRRWGATPAGGKGRQSSAKLASVDFCGCLWRALQNSTLENSGEVGRFSCLGCASGQGPSPRFPRFPNRGASEATGFHLRELLLPGSLDRWRRTPARAPGMVLGGQNAVPPPFATAFCTSGVSFCNYPAGSDRRVTHHPRHTSGSSMGPSVSERWVRLPTLA